MSDTAKHHDSPPVAVPHSRQPARRIAMRSRRSEEYRIHANLPVPTWLW